MNTTVHLLYFDGCPNVGEAKKNLQEAFRRAGRKPEWTEIDLNSVGCPPVWQGFPSPTVLVGEADVATGETRREGAPSCRFGGAPSPGQIEAALTRRSGLASFATVPAAAIALVPASFCPACYPALAGLIGALGLGAYGERLLAPLTAVLLLVALGGLAFQGRRRGDYRSLAAGALGAAAMYAGQFIVGSVLLKGLGIAFLVGASIWNVIPRLKGPGRGNCPDCQDSGAASRLHKRP